ncbi:DoxX family protein [Nakamurella aerolata]|uniref:DoxX family protein n=1 Tax=Nakamurella aerolata TaxID=1656892 RepID=A0A849A557_9ACTN|nr:DoxX family protein [Nakamurella aerolata]
MTIATIILSALLGLAFIGAGLGKLRRAEPVTGVLVRLGVSPGLQRMVGVLEVLGGIAAIVGFWLQPLGIIATSGLVLMMIGALVFHVRARDSFKEMSGAVYLLVLSVVVLIFQIVTV